MSLDLERELDFYKYYLFGSREYNFYNYKMNGGG